MKIRRTGSAEYGRHIKALICGHSGAGKTLISSTFPNPIWAATPETGLMSIADKQLPFVWIESSKDLLNLRNELDQPAEIREKLLGFPVDTLVIDTLDAIQGIFVAERLRETKSEALQRQDWGWLLSTMEGVVTGLRNLDMHVVFTCHLKGGSDDITGQTFENPSLQGAFSEKIHDYVDLSLLLTNHVKLEIQGTETVPVVYRNIQTFQDARHKWIKDHSGKLPPELPLNFEDDYKRISELIYGDIKELPKSEVDEVADALPPTLKDLVQETSPETVEPVAPKLKEKQAEKEDKGPIENNLACTVCGVEVDLDRAKLSNIRFRETLCNEHFIARREADA